MLGYRHTEVAPVQASACCGARVLWSTTGDWHFDQFNGQAAIRLGFPRIVVYNMLGKLKTWDWKTRDQRTGVKNAGMENAGPSYGVENVGRTRYGKPNIT